MDKTIVFDNNGAECGGMAGLLASLCNKQGIDPGYLMAMMNNRNGFGDMGAWWIIILLIFGWGGFGNGFGGGFGGRGTAQGLADLGNLVNNDAGRDLLMQAIQGNGQAISQLASTTHCDVNALQGAIASVSQSICQLGNAVGLGQQQIINSIQSGNSTLAAQLCECCCSTQRQIADFRGDIALQMCNQTNTLQGAINNVAVGQERGFSSVAYETQRQTCDLLKAINDGFSRVEYREQQREIQALRDERTQYQMSALLQQQSANIINTVRPCPIPAFVTCNPWGCNGGYFGNGYPYGGGCCGNNSGCNSGCGC